MKFGVHLRDASRAAVTCTNWLAARAISSLEAERLSGVFVITLAGIAGGDRFDIGVTVGEWGCSTLTNAGRKIYRAAGPAAQLNIALSAAPGAHLHGCCRKPLCSGRARISRRIDIDLAEDASPSALRNRVFGRAAMGEKMLHGVFVDRWRMRRGALLVFAEAIRSTAMIARSSPAPRWQTAASAIGTAPIVPGDEAVVERIRAASPTPSAVKSVSSPGTDILQWCASVPKMRPGCAPT